MHILHLRTFWGWWDWWDDTALQTQDSKFEPWRSEAEHATYRSHTLPTILTIYEWAGKKHFVSLNPEGQSGIWTRDLRFSKRKALITAPGPPPSATCIITSTLTSTLFRILIMTVAPSASKQSIGLYWRLFSKEAMFWVITPSKWRLSCSHDGKWKTPHHASGDEHVNMINNQKRCSHDGSVEEKHI